MIEKYGITKEDFVKEAQEQKDKNIKQKVARMFGNTKKEVGHDDHAGNHDGKTR